MKRAITSLFICCFVLVLFLTPALQSQGQSVSQAQCQAATSYLNKTLKTEDLRARVDRLAVYEYTYQYLELLTKRLTYNKQPQYATLQKELLSYRQSIDGFVESYESYDDARQKLADLDCQKELSEFSAELSKVRKERQALEQATIKVQKLLRASMKSQLKSLYDALLSAEPSGALNNE